MFSNAESDKYFKDLKFEMSKSGADGSAFDYGSKKKLDTRKMLEVLRAQD